MRAIVQKHCSRDALHYRRFTDKPEQNAEAAIANQKQIDIVKLAKGTYAILFVVKLDVAKGTYGI